ncbi:MAG: methyltransferase domain-containing protein [Anaerolineae bacterium]|nr:methyltransferase domain-containing protein [Anaerolineae bacterium]
MTITLDNLDFLASATGARLLERLEYEDLAEAHTLRLLNMLRREVSPQEAGTVLEMARLRLLAEGKFGTLARRMWFTREALEQASDPRIRRYRARGMSGMNVVDACCGIGADSLALAEAGAAVMGIDYDPVRVRIAQMNAAATELPARFMIGDVRVGLPEADVIFYDPARRTPDGKRLYDVEQYQPPLSLVKGWQENRAAQRVIVKLSPGVDLAQLTSYAGGVEFISVDGDLKEAVLWMGSDLAPGTTRATLLTETGTFSLVRQTSDPVVMVGEPRRWLLEPDASILRAGLVEDVALAVGAVMLDETIAYLTTDTAPESVWVRSWPVLDWMPFNLKHLRAYLRERNVGRVTVKKRGSAITPEELIPRLKLKGDESRVLVLTRCQEKQIVLICDEPG